MCVYIRFFKQLANLIMELKTKKIQYSYLMEDRALKVKPIRKLIHSV